MRLKIKSTAVLLILFLTINIMLSDCTSESITNIEKAEAACESTHYEISYVTMTAGPVAEDSVVIKKFNKMFNVSIKPIYLDSSRWEDLLTIKIASGNIPDVFASKTPDSFMTYVNNGLIQEVPVDLLKRFAPAVVEAVDRDSPDSWNLCSLNGRNFGFPLLIGNYVFRDPVVWRSDWLDKVGIEKTPDTIEEWEQAFMRFRNNDPDGNGGKDTYGCSLSVLGPVFGSFGVMVDMWWNGFWLDKDGKIIYSGIEPGAGEALKLLNKWYKNELLDPEFVTGENRGGYWAISDDFINGKIGVSALGNPSHWQKEGSGLISGPNQKQLKKVNPNAGFEYGNPPLGYDGRTRGTMKYPVCTGTTYVFSKNVESGKLQRILQMFNWSLESHANFMFNWLGEEGIHYKVIKENGYNTYESLEPYRSDRAEFFSKVGGSSVFWEYDVKNAHDVQKAFFDNFSKMGFDKYGIVDLFPTLYMPSYSKYGKDLQKLLLETYVSIITGTEPAEYFDEFVYKWKAEGGSQLLEEANAYYRMKKTQ